MSDDEQGRTQTGRALVLVVVVALIAVVVLRHTGSSVAGPARPARAAGAAVTTTTAPARPPASTTTLPAVAPADTTVEVLNGLEVGSLASNLSGRLRVDGYKTLPPDNATTLTPASMIYVVQAAYYPAATMLVSTLGLAAGTIQITRGLPASAPVPAGAATGTDLIVVIGTNLQLLASHPVTTAASGTTPPVTSAPAAGVTTTASSTTAASTTTAAFVTTTFLHHSASTTTTTR